MRKMVYDFFCGTSIEKNSDTIAVMDFLAAPAQVSRMIAATKNGMPALSGVVKDLEINFSNLEQFPITEGEQAECKRNRRCVGWMVRYIMGEYGYIAVESSKGMRLGVDSGAKYFTKGAVFKKIGARPKYLYKEVFFSSKRNWQGDEMFVGRGHEDYAGLSRRLDSIKIRMKALQISSDFLASFLRRTGFEGVFSNAQIQLALNSSKIPGIKIPCIEIVEAIEEALGLFEFFEEGRGEIR